MITTFLDQVYDMEFSKGENSYYMNQNFYPFFRRHERGILRCRISCSYSWKLYSISCISVGIFSNFLDMYSNSFTYNYIVLRQRNNIGYKKHFGTLLWIYITKYWMKYILNYFVRFDLVI